MAISARELLLIIRAQNQASAALRRVASDMKGLGRIQDLNLRRNQLAINQANTIRQSMRAEQALADLTTGRRALSAQAERVRILQRSDIAARNMQTTVRDLGVAEGKLARLQATGASETSQRMRQLTSQTERLRSRLAAQTNVLQNAVPAWEANRARMANNAAQVNRLQNELRTLGMRQTQTFEKMRTLNQEISAARWDKAIFGARAFSHAGRIAQLAGLGFGAALGFSADMAAKFQQKAQLVATQTGRVGSGFQTIIRNAEVLGDRILTTMSNSTSSMEDLTDAAYDIFSSLTLPDGGKGLKDGTAMLTQFSDAAIAGMTDVGTVGDGVIAVLNAFEEFKPTGKDVNTILNRMFAAVRFGRMTFSEFASTLGTTAPAARAAGQSLDTMAGTIAFLSRPLGINKAAVGFARLTEIIGRKAFVDGLKKAGVEITTAGGKMLQLPEIIDKITTKFPELTKGGVELVQFFKKMSGTEGTIQARRAFVFLAQQMDQYRKVLGQTVNDNNEFDRSLQAMSETVSVQWQQALNQLRVLALQIGAAVIPVLIQILAPVEDLVHWFSELDDETKQQIGQWAAWSAIVLLVGGTLAVIVGTIGSIVGNLAKMRILFSTVGVVVLAASVAIVALTGDLEALQNLGSATMDWLTGSWEGFIVGATLAATAALKVTSAMRSLAAMQGTVSAASAAGAVGPGGIMPMLMRAPGSLRAYGSLVKEASVGTNIFTKSLAGAGAALALMPVSLGIAAGAIALFAAGAVLWKMHADGMKEKAAELAAEQERLAAAINEANAAARGMAGFAPAVGDFKRAKLDIEDINASIKELRTQMKGARGEERAGMQRQIERLILDRADAQQFLGEASKTAGASLRAFNDTLQAQATIFGELGVKQAEAAKLQEKIAEFSDVAGPAPAIVEALEEQLARVNGQIDQLEAGSQQATNTMVAGFTDTVRQLQNMGELPQKITSGAIKDALELQVTLGRVMDRKELRMFFKAEIDPKSLAAMPKRIRDFIKTRQKERIEIAADIKLARKKLTVQEMKMQGPDFEAGLNTTQAKQDAQNLVGWFKANKELPPFHASVTPSGTSLGVALAQGVVAGFGSVNLTVHILGQMNNVRDAAAKNEEAGSPSKRWAREVGLPIAQGLLMGMIEGFAQIDPEIKKGSKKWKNAMKKAWGDIIETAGQTITDKYLEFRDALDSTFFEPLGELNQLRMDWGLILNTDELTADLRQQTKDLRAYSANWTELSRKKVPLDLLLQLSEMGEEGTAIIESLAGASKKDLKAYVKAWRAAQKQLDKVAKQQLNSQIKNWRSMGKAMAFGIMAGLRDEEHKLQKFFERLFKNMFKDAQKHNKSKSPSRLYMKEGRNIVEGLQAGMEQGADLRVPMPAIGRGLTRGRAVQAGGGGNVNMTIHATHGESLMTTLERARFRMKHRR